MLQKIPKAVGHALHRIRAGADDLAIAHTELTGTHATIEISSPAFSYNQRIPSAYTADGRGISPPLQWDGVPENAKSLALLIEDADSPTPKPLVHAIAWNLPAADGLLPEGALGGEAAERDIETTGRNSFLMDHYLPPDPPPGHGPHRYVFQIFALDTQLNFDKEPGRKALLDAIRGHVLAKGLHIGVYERP